MVMACDVAVECAAGTQIMLAAVGNAQFRPTMPQRTGRARQFVWGYAPLFSQQETGAELRGGCADCAKACAKVENEQERDGTKLKTPKITVSTLFLSQARRAHPRATFQAHIS